MATGSNLYRMRIGRKMTAEKVEEAVGAASQEAMAAGAAAGAELARVDLLGKETVVFFRGDKAVANALKAVLTKRSRKAKVP